MQNVFHLSRFTDDCFSENFSTTIGVDFKIRTLEVKGDRRAKIQIWDLATNTRKCTLTPEFGGVSTVDVRVDYLRHAVEQDLVCVAEIARLGNRVAAARMRVEQEGGRVVAEGRAVYNVQRPDGRPSDGGFSPDRDPDPS